jgi:hypothetical protein
MTASANRRWHGHSGDRTEYVQYVPYTECTRYVSEYTAQYGADSLRPRRALA